MKTIRAAWKVWGAIWEVLVAFVDLVWTGLLCILGLRKWRYKP